MLEIVVRNAPDAVAARKGGATQLLQARYSGSWMTPGVDVINFFGAFVRHVTFLMVVVELGPPPLKPGGVTSFSQANSVSPDGVALKAIVVE